MKIIGISLYANDSGKSGISQYMINILAELINVDNDNKYVLFLAKEDRHLFKVPDSDRFIFVESNNIFNKPVLNIIWHQVVFPILIIKYKIDVLFMPAANRRLTWYKNVPTVGMVHDLCQMHIENKYDSFRMFYVKNLLPFLARRLTKVLTPSQCSKDDVVKFYKISEDKISVVFNGIDHKRYFNRNKNHSKKAICGKYSIKPEFILYISRLEHPGKNHVRLISAYAKLKQEQNISHQLVLVGSKWNGSEVIFKHVKDLGLENDVVFPGFVNNEDLPVLISAADVFVYPSLFEGFGIPIIEAMASSVPVACSNVSSLPEVAGEASLFFNPLDICDISKKLSEILTSIKIQTDLVDKGLKRAKVFNWFNAASQTFDIMKLMSK